MSLIADRLIGKKYVNYGNDEFDSSSVDFCALLL